MKIIISFCFISVLILSAKSQVSNYQFSTEENTVFETGNFTNLMGGNQLDVYSEFTNIGFTGKFNGADYASFYVTSDALLTFAQAVTIVCNNQFITSSKVLNSSENEYICVLFNLGESENMITE